MKNEIKEIIKSRIRTELQIKIRGEIKLHYENDSLYIKIYNQYTKPYLYVILDVYEMIDSNLSSQNVANEIYKQYRKFITNYFFY